MGDGLKKDAAGIAKKLGPFKYMRLSRIITTIYNNSCKDCKEKLWGNAADNRKQDSLFDDQGKVKGTDLCEECEKKNRHNLLKLKKLGM